MIDAAGIRDRCQRSLWTCETKQQRKDGENCDSNVASDKTGDRDKAVRLVHFPSEAGSDCVFSPVKRLDRR
jgi:hypothetical protein